MPWVPGRYASTDTGDDIRLVEAGKLVTPTHGWRFTAAKFFPRRMVRAPPAEFPD